MAKSQKRIVIGNWKMNPTTLDKGKSFVISLEKGLGKVKADVVICPPSIFLSSLVGSSKRKTKKGLKYGAQNCAIEKSGAFTGEISSEMIRDSGGEYVIVGHSERRRAGETDVDISKKAATALREGLSVILCVGENVRDEQGEYLHFLERQIAASMPVVPRKLLEKLSIAYEPVWAIGESARGPATPEEVFETVILIRKILSQISSKEFAMKVSLIYGGSVDPTNAREFIERGGVQGLLVGRDSLDPVRFLHIIREVDSVA